MTTETQEQTIQAIAEEYVKQNTSSDIVAELVAKEESIQRLRETQEYSRNRVNELKANMDKIKKFIIEHVENDDSASPSELKELAEDLEIELTKDVDVNFTVTYNLTVRCALGEEVDQTDFRVDLNYDGGGELINEESDWSAVEIVGD